MSEEHVYKAACNYQKLRDGKSLCELIEAVMELPFTQMPSEFMSKPVPQADVAGLPNEDWVTKIPESFARGTCGPVTESTK